MDTRVLILMYHLLNVIKMKVINCRILSFLLQKGTIVLSFTKHHHMNFVYILRHYFQQSLLIAICQ